MSRITIEPYFAVSGIQNMSRDRPRYHDTPQCIFAARLDGYDLKKFAETTATLDQYDDRFICVACGKKIGKVQHDTTNE